MEDRLPWEGPHAGAGEGREEEGAAGTTPEELTATPVPLRCSVGGGRENWEQSQAREADRAQGKAFSGWVWPSRSSAGLPSAINRTAVPERAESALPEPEVGEGSGPRSPLRSCPAQEGSERASRCPLSRRVKPPQTPRRTGEPGEAQAEPERSRRPGDRASLPPARACSIPGKQRRHPRGTWAARPGERPRANGRQRPTASVREPAAASGRPLRAQLARPRREPPLPRAEPPRARARAGQRRAAEPPPGRGLRERGGRREAADAAPRRTHASRAVGRAVRDSISRRAPRAQAQSRLGAVAGGRPGR